jgi:hypothetical protein
MIRLRFVALVFVILLLSPKVFSDKSRTMSSQEYAAFIDNLDAAVSSCQAQISRLYKVDLPPAGEKHEQPEAKGIMAYAVLGQAAIVVWSSGFVRDYRSMPCGDLGGVRSSARNNDSAEVESKRHA